MSRFTQCKEAVRRTKVAPPAVLVKIVLALSVMLAFGLAHIHLRVRLSQTRRQIGVLQAEQGRLLSDVKAVRGENEALKNPKALQAYASHELGMVSYNPA